MVGLASERDEGVAGDPGAAGLASAFIAAGVVGGSARLAWRAARTMAWFPYQAGINETSGIVAYASRWQTNGAIFPAAEAVVQRSLGALSLDVEMAGRITRAIFAAIIAGVALALAWHPLRDGLDVLQRATLIVAAMVLFSPAQYSLVPALGATLARLHADPGAVGRDCADAHLLCVFPFPRQRHLLDLPRLCCVARLDSDLGLLVAEALRWRRGKERAALPAAQRETANQY